MKTDEEDPFIENLKKIEMANGLEMDWDQTSYKSEIPSDDDDSESFRTTFQRRSKASGSKKGGSKGFKGFGMASLNSTQ